MKCERIDLGNGDFAIACSRGDRKTRACSSCGAHVGDGVLCDFLLKGGGTCDRRCCRKCAKRVGALDYCPPHTRYVAGNDSPATSPAENKNKNKDKDKDMTIVGAQNIADALNLRGAKVVQRSKKMHGGFEGRVRIKRIELGPTRNGPALFVKYEVVQTNDEENAPVGTERTWKQSLMTSKGAEPAMNNILVFAACCAGMDPAEADEVEAASDELDDLVKAACKSPDDNTFVDVEVGLCTEDTVTDGGKGRPYVIHMWAP